MNSDGPQPHKVVQLKKQLAAEDARWTAEGLNAGMMNVDMLPVVFKVEALYNLLVSKGLVTSEEWEIEFYEQQLKHLKAWFPIAMAAKAAHVQEQVRGQLLLPDGVKLEKPL